MQHIFSVYISSNTYHIETSRSELLIIQCELVYILSNAARPASYTMGIGGCFLGDKAAGAWSWLTHVHIVPKARMVELYLRSPTRFHGVTINLLINIWTTSRLTVIRTKDTDLRFETFVYVKCIATCTQVSSRYEERSVYILVQSDSYFCLVINKSMRMDGRSM
jgi:hypothetical protein